MVKGNRTQKKTGKTFNKKEYSNVQSGCGTMDYINLKSIYLYFSCWTTSPSEDMEKLGGLIKKDILANLDDRYLQNKFAISIVECTSNKTRSRPFCHMEYNIFVKPNTELYHIKDNISNIQDLIHQKYYLNKTEFEKLNGKRKYEKVTG